MPATISHALSATTPDNTSYEIRPSHWNSSHIVTLAPSGAEVIGAFSNSNGISFGTEAGGGITGSYTVPTQSVQTQASGAIAGTATAITGGAVITLNSGGLSFNGAGLAGTATAITGGAVVTLNSAGLSFNGAGLAGTATAITGGAVVTLNSAGMSFNGAGLAGTATAITGGAVVTLNSAGMSFNGSGLAGTATAITGNASITLNSAGLSFNGSGLAGTATAITGNASITLNSTGLSFNGSGLAGTATAITGRASITLNSTGLSFNGSALVGSGTATAKTGNIALTLSPNSSSIAISIDAGSLMGTGGTTGTTTGLWSFTGASGGLSMVTPYLTRYIWPPGNLTAVTAPGNASQSNVYVAVPRPLTGSRLDMLLAMSHSSSGGAGTVSYVQSRYAIIYTRNASTLSSLSSGSTQTTYSYASNTAGATYLTNSAIYPISVPVNFNMAPGEYIVGVNIVTAATAASATQSLYGGNQIQTALNYIDFAATASSTNQYGGMGIHSVATTGIVTRHSLSDINQTGSALSAANIALVFRNA